MRGPWGRPYTNTVTYLVVRKAVYDLLLGGSSGKVWKRCASVGHPSVAKTKAALQTLVCNKKKAYSGGEELIALIISRAIFLLFGESLI